MRTKWLRILATVLAMGLVAAACSGDSGSTTPETVTVTSIVTETVVETSIVTETVEVPATNELAGTTVTVFGPESSDVEAGAFQAALDLFAAANGMTIAYTGARDFSDQINVQVAGGNPPDIGILPQPGKLADFARQGVLIPLADEVTATVQSTTPEGLWSLGEVDGVQYGIPTKADLKSLVWYQPALFAEKGYTVPETWDELKELTNTMISNGDTPWCVGIDSGGGATGWPFTDWTEDLMLRFYGGDVYDQWVTGDVRFSDERVVSVFNEIRDLWDTPGATYAAGGSIATTLFGDNGPPLADGTCMMHRQANFFAAFLPEGTVFGPDGVDVFYFPPVDPAIRPVLGGGVYPVAFRDAPEVAAVMEYMASAEYANARQRFQNLANGGGAALSGFLSPNSGADQSLWQPLEQSFLDVLSGAEIFRFDGSDNMPTPVNAEFWRSATAFVNGDIDAVTAAEAIDANW
jgi:alpha-glucoside transport system substrate-binding protein